MHKAVDLLQKDKGGNKEPGKPFLVELKLDGALQLLCDPICAWMGQAAVTASCKMVFSYLHVLRSPVLPAPCSMACEFQALLWRAPRTGRKKHRPLECQSPEHTARQANLRAHTSLTTKQASPRWKQREKLAFHARPWLQGSACSCTWWTGTCAATGLARAWTTACNHSSLTLCLAPV